MPDARDETLRFKVGSDEDESIRGALLKVYNALKERGYDPVNQLVGYLLRETLLTLPATRTPGNNPPSRTR